MIMMRENSSLELMMLSVEILFNKRTDAKMLID